MGIINFIRTCAKNIGGNMYVFLTEVANIYSITVTAGEVSDIKMVDTNTFKQIQADANGIVRLCLEGSTEQSKVFYNHTVAMTISKARTELNDLANQLAEASACGIVAIVMDSNGQSWLVGYGETDKGERPLFLQADNFTSGKDLTEPEGGKRTFQLFTTSGFIDLPMNATINDYILDSIAAGADIGFIP